MNACCSDVAVDKPWGGGAGRTQYSSHNGVQMSAEFGGEQGFVQYVRLCPVAILDSDPTTSRQDKMPVPPGCPTVCLINGCAEDVTQPEWDKKRWCYRFLDFLGVNTDDYLTSVNLPTHVYINADFFQVLSFSSSTELLFAKENVVPKSPTITTSGTRTLCCNWLPVKNHQCISMLGIRNLFRSF